jgi:excinuclease UvrABC nuclease subunit
MRISGIYVFWGVSGECLYVGSSIDMRGRVRTNKHRKLAARVEMFEFPPDDLVDCDLFATRLVESR